MGEENQYFDQGTERVIVHYAGWRIALFVCYDLRFPVWCRTIRDADLVIFTANWPESRKIVWQTLVPARAIENQLYVAAVNRTGTDGSGINYMGASMVVDPRGAINGNIALDQEMVVSCTLSLEDLLAFRKKFPVERDEDNFTISC
jgi:predicted amidohydrolase